MLYCSINRGIPHHNPDTRILLDTGAHANATDRAGLTALEHAVRRGLVAETAVLLAAGARVNVCDNGGSTPLLTAACAAISPSSRIALLRMLLEAGADGHARDNDGDGALWYAVLSEDLEAVRLLLQAGADVNGKNESDHTPLMVAVKADQPTELIECLLQNGAAIDQQDDDGDTALHWTALLDCDTAARALLHAGANIDVRNVKGHRPEDVAFSKGHRETLGLLRAWRDRAALQTEADAAREGPEASAPAPSRPRLL